MWHTASYQGRELLVIGHSPRRNDCILVDLAGLPMNEATDLKRIAQSVPGQEQERLVVLLKDLTSPDKIQDWFTYICRKMEQRNGPVFTLPLKEIQDTLDEDQRAIFKGYGKGRKNKHLETLAESEDIDAVLPGSDTRPINSSIDPDHRLRVGVETKAHELGSKMDTMLETLVDESRRTQQLLSKLIGALTDTPVEEPAAQVYGIGHNQGPSLDPPKSRRTGRKAKQQNTEGAQV
jgi:hypothetical protein